MVAVAVLLDCMRVVLLELFCYCMRPHYVHVAALMCVVCAACAVVRDCVLLWLGLLLLPCVACVVVVCFVCLVYVFVWCCWRFDLVGWSLIVRLLNLCLCCN